MPFDSEFIAGLELSRALYLEAVRPLLDTHYPDLPHSAARIGPGSEVLGFDTAQSADHDWGPRLQLFLPAHELAVHGAEISALLSRRLPKTIRGWSTHFGGSPADAVATMEPAEGPVNHRVEIAEPSGWLSGRLGVDATQTLTTRDWLSMPQQRLAEVVGGAVFHDGLSQLDDARRRLAWYPDQVWRYLLACQWMKLSQEEAFVGRAAQVGDRLGSAVAAARQVRELMRLAFLIARRYAPYTKWLGSAFSRDIPDTEPLEQLLRNVLSATAYPDREAGLCGAYEELAQRQNALGLTPEPVEATRRPYHSRPFQVIHAERFATAIADSIADPDLRALPLTGAVDQWADNTDFLSRHAAIRAHVDEMKEMELPCHTKPGRLQGQRHARRLPR